jgi:integrase
MATVYQHPSSKFYFARFTDPSTGRRVSKSTKCIAKKQAKIVAGKFQAAARDESLRADVPRILQRSVELASLEAQAGTLTLERAETLIRLMAAAANPTAKEGTFRRFSGAWLDELEPGITKQSFTDYHRAVKQAVAALGDKAEGPLRRITTMDVEGIKTAFAATGATGCTINKQFAVIRRIFQSAVDCGALDLNPAKSIKTVSTSDSVTRKPFTLPEVRSLIAVSPSPEWRGLITLAASTGLRCHDVRTLTSENISGHWLTIQPDKTSKSTGAVVNVPLTPSCTAWLEGRPTGQLFPELAKLSASKISLTFDEIMSKAKVEKTIVLAPGDPPKVGSRSFHSLRHFFISMLAQVDVNADVRMKLAGHSSQSVHADYTDHGDALQRAIRQLPTL